VAVVFHDSRLDRTSDGGGRVRNTMWRDLALLDAGGWFSPRFAGTRIPRLEDWLDAAADLGLGLNLEIKPDRGDGPETAAALAAAVAARWPGRLPPPIVSSFDSAALRWLREQRSGLPLALLRRLWPANPQREIAAVGADALHIPDRIARADRLAAARQAGLTLRVYTINNRHRAETLLDAGVAAVFSDAPDRLLRR